MLVDSGARAVLAILTLCCLAPHATASEAQLCHNLRLDPPIRIEACSRAMADPNASAASQVDLLSARAMALDDLGDYARAIQDYDAAVVLAPGDPYLHLNRGVAKIHSGRPADAIADYDRAVQLKPGWHLPYFNRAVALYELGQRAAALADFERAIARKATDPWIYVGQGDVLGASGDAPGALEAYDKALALRPTLDDARAKRAGLLLRLDQPQGALAELDAVLTRNPAKANLWRARAEAKFQLARFSEAITDLRQALALSPDDKALRRELVRAQLAAGDGEEAWNTIARAPEGSDALDLALAAQVALLTDRGAALGLAQRAVGIKPGDGRIEALLALAQDRAGNVDGARQAAERAILFAPHDAEVAAIARRLGAKVELAALPDAAGTPAKEARNRCIAALEAGDAGGARAAGAGWSLCHLAAGP
jgi:tetratricopeptide (TPR) repeat protein